MEIATAEELATIRRLHADEAADWMPEDGYPIRDGLSAYGVVDLLLATIDEPVQAIGSLLATEDVCEAHWPTFDVEAIEVLRKVYERLNKAS